MGLRNLFLPILIPCFFILIACRPDAGKPGQAEQGCGSRSYKQGLKTDVAWIVLEWNCQIQRGGYGSGFLVDKEKGAFYTNKHVSNMFNAFGRGSHKIFFNGKVYNAEVVQTPPLADAALIRTTDNFKPSEFPEPATVSYEKLKVNDKVWMGGFHPHPYYVRQSDEEEGYKFQIIPIYKDYYRASTRNLEKEKEVVFEKLEGKVVELDLAWDEVIKRLEKRSGKKFPAGNFIEEIGNRTNFFIEIKTLKDHKFPFGGLSGSPARNSKGEIVGILTRQDLFRYDYDKEELEETGMTVIRKQLWDTIYLTPIESTKELTKFLK